MHLTKELLKKNPEICSYDAPLQSTHWDISAASIRSLARRQRQGPSRSGANPSPRSLVLCSISGADMPSLEYQLMRLFGLSPSVKRVMCHHQSCFADGIFLCTVKHVIPVYPAFTTRPHSMTSQTTRNTNKWFQ
ncbi:Methyltransf_21 domain-containing protein [Psidium guajava]|nr:Methyltransf_21 domain-containing protein [Psidium guajava]